MYKVRLLVYNIIINRLIRTFEIKLNLQLPLFIIYLFYFVYETKIETEPIDTILFSLKSRRDDETSFYMHEITALSL